MGKDQIIRKVVRKIELLGGKTVMFDSFGRDTCSAHYVFHRRL